MPSAKPIPGQSLADLYPELAKEALFDAREVRAGRGFKMPWRCGKCFNVFEASPNARVAGKAKCRRCYPAKLGAGSDLATKFPDIAKTLLGDPSKIPYSSPRIFSWVCLKCKNIYKCSANKRTRKSRGNGCPVCFGKKAIPGENDLLTKFPDIAKEAMFDASTVRFGSNRKLRWKCSKCSHQWVSPPARRTGPRAGGCAVCAGKLVIPGVNDFATHYPDLAKECLSDTTKFSRCSGRYCLWRCSKCAFEWKAIVSNRVKGRGCPLCKRRGGFKPEGLAWVYLIAKQGIQKVGITGKISDRLERHKSKGWKVVDIKRVRGAVARDIESQCKFVLDKIGALRGRAGFRHKFDGWTESWQTVDFYADSLDTFTDRLYSDVWDKVFSVC